MFLKTLLIIKLLSKQTSKRNMTFIRAQWVIPYLKHVVATNTEPMSRIFQLINCCIYTETKI